SSGKAKCLRMACTSTGSAFICLLHRERALDRAAGLVSREQAGLVDAGVDVAPEVSVAEFLGVQREAVELDDLSRLEGGQAGGVNRPDHEAAELALPPPAWAV